MKEIIKYCPTFFVFKKQRSYALGQRTHKKKTMKKNLLFTLLTLIALTSLTSCQKDKDDPENDSNAIVGTSWVYSAPVEHEPEYTAKMTIKFNDNNKVTVSDELYKNGVLVQTSGTIATGSYSYKAPNGSMTITADGETETVNFTVNANKLTLSGSGFNNQVFTKQ